MDNRALYLKALMRRAEVLHVAGAFKRSAADFKNVLSLSRSGQDKRDALIGLSAAYGEIGEYDLKLSYANRLLKVAIKMDLYSRGKALMVKGDALRDKGKYESSLETLKRSIGLFRRAQNGKSIDRQMIQDNISKAYNNMGMAYNIQGRYASALTFYKKSLDLTEKIGNLVATTQATNNIGLIYWYTGKYGLAMDYFNRSLAFAQKTGFKSGISAILGNIGLVYNDLEKSEIALGYFLKAIAISKEIGHQASTGTHLNNAGLTYSNMSDLHNAHKFYAQSLNIFQKIGNARGKAMVLYNIGMNNCYRGDYKKALVYESEAEKIARSGNILEAVIRCDTLKACIFTGLKKYAAAIRIIKGAIRSAEKNKMEDLRIDALKQYARTVIEEKNRVRLTGLSKEIAQLEVVYGQTTTDMTRCLLLDLLVKYYLAVNQYETARKKLSELTAIARKSKDKYIIAETLIVQAMFNRATGKPCHRLLAQARPLIKELGYYSLLDGIRMVGK